MTGMEAVLVVLSELSEDDVFALSLNAMRARPEEDDQPDLEAIADKEQA